MFSERFCEIVFYYEKSNWRMISLRKYARIIIWKSCEYAYCRKSIPIIRFLTISRTVSPTLTAIKRYKLGRMKTVTRQDRTRLHKVHIKRFFFHRETGSKIRVFRIYIHIYLQHICDYLQKSVRGSRKYP